MNPFSSLFISRIIVFSLTATALLPLVSVPPWLAPPDWGKAVLLRLLLSLAWCLFLWQVLSGNHRIPRVEWRSSQGLLLSLLLAFLVLFGIATLLSQDINFSLWGDPVRSGGFVNLVFFISFPFLLFLALKPADWNLILKGFLWGAIGVSVIALLQWEARAVSTVGSTMALALFLLLVAFFFLARLRNWSLLLLSVFLFVILLTQSRAAWLGLATGVLFYVLFLPGKRWWQDKKRRVLFSACLVLAISFLFFFSIAPALPQEFQRFRFPNLQEEPRFSAWRVSMRALKEKPLFGYGPENFSIGFDRHYDPSLPNIGRARGSGITTWWDRAHNIFLDIGTQAGLGTVLIYLALFATLFWILHKKKQQGGQTVLQAHALQAAFLAYLVANLFSFETFSPQYAFFLLVGYTLYLNSHEGNSMKIPSFPLAIPLFVASTLFLVWFNWRYTIQPLQVNKNLVIARYFLEQAQCTQALPYLEKAIRQKGTMLDAYLFLTYGEAMVQCKNQLPSQKAELIQKGREALSETVRLRPTHTRTWIALGGLTNLLLEEVAQKGGEDKATQLQKEAQQYFKKALQLAPKRQETYIEWTKTFLIQGNYGGARDKAAECLSLNQQSPHCWFLLARAEISLGNIEKGEQALARADNLGYGTTEQTLLQLANAYLVSENYENMAKIYETLITDTYGPQNPRYHTVLATLYERLGKKEQFLMELAQLAYLMGNYDESFQHTKECLAVNVQSLACWGLLGRVELARGNGKASKQAFEQYEYLNELQEE